MTNVLHAAAEKRSGGRSTSFESRTASRAPNSAVSTQLFIPVERLLRRHDAVDGAPGDGGGAERSDMVAPSGSRTVRRDPAGRPGSASCG